VRRDSEWVLICDPQTKHAQQQPCPSSISSTQRKFCSFSVDFSLGPSGTQRGADNAALSLSRSDLMPLHLNPLHSLCQTVNPSLRGIGAALAFSFFTFPFCLSLSLSVGSLRARRRGTLRWEADKKERAPLKILSPAPRLTCTPLPSIKRAPRCGWVT